MRAPAITCRVALTAGCLLSLGLLTAACGTTGPAAPSSTKTVTVTVTPTPSGPTTTTPAPPSIPQCATTALKLTVGRENGAAGTIYYPLEFTNISSSTCTMYGYPGVAFVTAPHGSVIGAPAGRRGIVTSPTLITLAPGVTAHAVLGVSDVLVSNNCLGHRVQVHWVQVYPPDQYTALYAPFNILGCGLKSLVTMNVSSVISGVSGP